MSRTEGNAKNRNALKKVSFPAEVAGQAGHG
jgi:hypothetical protein